MAQASAVKSYDAIGIRESLTDIVANISPDKTPIFSQLEKGKAGQRVHSWQTDTLATGSDNAQIEGSDYSFALPTARTLVSNYTQIFGKTVEVSRTMQAVTVAGIEDEFEHQLKNKMRELATDIEKALITGTGNSGASGTAPRLKGFLSFIATNVETGTGTGSETLTETMYNDLLQDIWAQGGTPDATYVNAFQKRKISQFATSNTRQLDMTSSNKLVNRVDVYESDFGTQEVYLDNFMDTDKVLVVQRDMAQVAMLYDIEMTDVATIGRSKRAALDTELTLVVKNEKAHGKVTELATS